MPEKEMKYDREGYKHKSSSRIQLNTSLLGIVIGIFFLTINLRQELLLPKIVATQLVLSIPLLLTSILAYSKMGYRKATDQWNILGWTTFNIAFAFILNVIGIMLANVISWTTSFTFFAVSWILVIIYSIADYIEDKSVLKEKLIKDSLFILIQIILGIFVILGFIG